MSRTHPQGLGIGQKISLSFMALIALTAVVAGAGGMAMLQVLDGARQERDVRMASLGISSIAPRAMHFINSRERRLVDEVFRQLDTSLLWLNRQQENKTLDAKTQQQIQADLKAFRALFHQQVALIDQHGALESEAATQGKQLAVYIQKLQETDNGVRGYRLLDSVINKVLQLQLLVYELSEQPGQPEVLDSMQQLLAALASERRAFAGTDEYRFLLFHLEQTVRSYVSVFERLAAMHESQTRGIEQIRTLTVQIREQIILGEQALHETTQARLQRAMVASGLAFLVVLLVAVWLSTFLRQQILDPLLRLARATDAISRGELMSRVQPQADDELGSLARSFNRMAERIQEYWQVLSDRNDELQQVRLQLEQQVEARTQELGRVSQALQQEEQGRHTLEETAWRQANFDALTGLPNQRMFRECLHKEALGSERRQQKLAVLFLDLDRFRDVNDSLGHEQGDYLLQEAAQRLQRCIRQSDLLSRQSGDEFGLILPHIDDHADARRVADSILKKMATPYELAGERVHISASIGISLYPDDSTEPEALLRHAEQAMFAAKNEGRNRFCFFSRDMQVKIHRRAHLIHDLFMAIEQQQFALYLQPVIDLRTGHCSKAEALLRWQHPTEGMISPAEFIPLAEETRQIIPLGEWVFREALGHLSALQNQCGKLFQVSVNKSPVQLHGRNESAELWCQQMVEQGMDPRSLIIEITEDTFFESTERVQKKLKAYRAEGVEFAIDDFGTGYSSLAYLNRFDVSYLKIDRSFVSRLAEGNNDHTICVAIIAMAHSLGIRVIAEGIETLEQLELLRNAGCDLAQGFLIARPMPLADFVQRHVGTGGRFELQQLPWATASGEGGSA